jgi:xanthine dehydrogenase accessory factor
MYVMKNSELLKIMSSMLERGEPFALATVVRIEGSSLGKPGFKALLSKDGEIIYGTIGGVCPESAIAEVAKEVLNTGAPKIIRVHLESVENALEAIVTGRKGDDIYVETNCGGMMEIYVEPYLHEHRLVIVGQGGKDDVEDALVKLGKMLGFTVVVIDHSPYLSEQPDVLISSLDFDITKFEFKETDSVVILTKGSRDVEILKGLSNFNVMYVGLLASKQRTKTDIEQLVKEGVKKDFIAKIRAPIGLDIGAVTPEEIAVSIMAEIIATKRKKVETLQTLAMKKD